VGAARGDAVQEDRVVRGVEIRRPPSISFASRSHWVRPTNRRRSSAATPDRARSGRPRAHAGRDPSGAPVWGPIERSVQRVARRPASLS
jgi:hypothetical protein